MNIAIVGAGIIGVTTAYELATQGHAVTVFERHGAAAEEASFATAGLIAPGYLGPWAPANAGARALQRLYQPHERLRLRWPFGLRELRWMEAWRRAGDSTAWRERRQAMQHLAEASRQRLHELTMELELEYDCSPGLLVLLRSAREQRRFEGVPAQWEALSVRQQVLDAAGARMIEPALDPDRAMAAAIYLPDEGVANCRQVAQLLRRHAEALGVRFEFGTAVLPLDRASPALLRVGTGAQQPRSLSFDAVVVCAGAGSAQLLRPLGVRLPIEQVWGHAVTAPIGEPFSAPRSAVLDEHHKVVISRLGDRVRVSGGAQLGGPRDQRDPEVIRRLYQVLQDWFPGAARLSGRNVTVQEWSGASPMLPDGAPVLGHGSVPGVWLNVAHAAHGWALAMGSARALADAIGGQPAEVDIAPLRLARLAA